MIQNLGNRKSVQKCAQKAGSYALKILTYQLQKSNDMLASTCWKMDRASVILCFKVFYNIKVTYTTEDNVQSKNTVIQTWGKENKI